MRVPRVHAKERPPRLKAPEIAELGSTELYNPWSSFGREKKKVGKRDLDNRKNVFFSSSGNLNIFLSSSFF